MSAAAAVRAERVMGCSPVMTLRLLAMADDAESVTIDEPEQLVLPLEWAWSVPKRREPEPPKPSTLPDPKQWGARVTLAAFEVMLGNRPANQMARLVDSKILHVLALHTNRMAIERRKQRNIKPTRPRITSVRCFQPHPDAAEVTAVLHDGMRIRAVALRLAARGGQWVATAFELG